MGATAETLGRGVWTGAMLGIAAAGAHGLLVSLVMIAGGLAGISASPTALVSGLVLVGLCTATVGVLIGFLLGSLHGLLIGALATVCDAGLPAAAVLVTGAGWAAITWSTCAGGIPVWVLVSVDALGLGVLAVITTAAALHAVHLRRWRREGADPHAPLCLAPAGSPA